MNPNNNKRNQRKPSAKKAVVKTTPKGEKPKVRRTQRKRKFNKGPRDAGRRVDAAVRREVSQFDYTEAAKSLNALHKHVKLLRDPFAKGVFFPPTASGRAQVYAHMPFSLSGKYTQKLVQTDTVTQFLFSPAPYLPGSTSSSSWTADNSKSGMGILWACDTSGSCYTNNFQNWTSSLTGGTVSIPPLSYVASSAVGSSDINSTNYCWIGCGVRVTARPNAYCVPRMTVLDPARYSSGAYSTNWRNPDDTGIIFPRCGYLSTSGTNMAYTMQAINTGVGIASSEFTPIPATKAQINMMYPRTPINTCPTNYYKTLTYGIPSPDNMATYATVWAATCNGGCPPGIYFTADMSTGGVCEFEIEVVHHYAVMALAEAQTVMFNKDVSDPYPEDWYDCKSYPTTSGIGKEWADVDAQICAIMRAKLNDGRIPRRLIEGHAVNNLPSTAFVPPAKDFNNRRPMEELREDAAEEIGIDDDACSSSSFPTACRTYEAVKSVATPKNMQRAAEVVSNVVSAYKAAKNSNMAQRQRYNAIQDRTY